MHLLTKIFLGTIVLCIAAIAILVATTAGKERDPMAAKAKGAEKVVLGNFVSLSSDKKVISPDGFHTLRDVSAWLAVRGRDEIKLDVRPEGQRQWEDPIKLTGTTVNGVLTTTNRETIRPRVSVRLPSDDTLVGERVTVKFSGRVQYPDISHADVRDTSKTSYDIADEAWKGQTALFIVATAADLEPPKQPAAAAWVSLSCFAATIMGAVAGLRRMIFGPVAPRYPQAGQFLPQTYGQGGQPPAWPEPKDRRPPA